MTQDDVRAAAEQVIEFPERFAPLFGKEQAQDHAYDYLKGLMICPERKSIEPIALLVGHGDASGLQKFVGTGPWPYDDVQAEAQSLFADELVPSAAGSPVGTVGVIDESGFTKKGAHSAGVARQHNGRLGKEDNCQVGVFLVGVTPAGSALLDHQLFLPESWCEPTRAAKDRRAKAHIPEGLPFRTKPRIAAALVRAVAVLGTVVLDWVVADEEYGRAGHFLDELEALEQRYVVEVPVTTAVWTADPATCIPAYSGRGRKPTAPARDAVRTVAALAAELPGSAWQALQVREGAVGPLVFEFAAVRVWAMRHRKPGPPAWLLIRRSLGAEPEVKYYVSNAGEQTLLSTLALVACTRCRVEEFFEDCKSYLGMAQYETRSWVGWHHHMTLVGLAHLFVTLTRRRLHHHVPELTLDRTVRLLEAALEEPELKLPRAIALVDYHIHRNKVAKVSHDKTWKKKHRKVKYLRL
ncbi:MAG TPA: IS701 family transposase [Isosphaeraceae bacterium]|nr:IS701 family transposase [Isosphaeraceae bacterium]